MTSPQKKRKTNPTPLAAPFPVSFEEAKVEYLDKLRNLGIHELKGGKYPCPASCGKDIEVDDEFSRLYSTSFHALAVVRHIANGECSNDDWVYTVIAGPIGAKLYVGYWKGHELLLRWTRHHFGKWEGYTGSVIVGKWGGLYGILDETPRLLNLKDVALAVLDVRPGNTLTEAHHFEALWCTGLSISHSGLRGGLCTTDMLAPGQYKELERKLRQFNNLCHKCGISGHYARSCTKSTGISDKHYGTVHATSSYARALRELETEENQRNAEESWTVTDDDHEVEEFRSFATDEQAMFCKLYGQLAKDDILAVGYVDTASTQVRERAPEIYKKMGYPMVTLAQKQFTESIISAIDGETDEDVTFLNVGTGGGKTLAFIMTALHVVVERSAKVLILLPQRNVVEDIARGVLTRLTHPDTKRRKKLEKTEMRMWDSSYRDDHCEDDVLLGGDIVTADGDEIRWSVYMGSGGIPSLRKLMDDKEWIEGVDVFVATIDMVYAKFLPKSFLDGLQLVLFDEADMAKDDFGVNTAYLFGQLRMTSSREDKMPIVFGLGTATCTRPTELAQRLLQVPSNRVKVVEDHRIQTYVKIFQKTPDEQPLTSDHEDDSTPNAVSLYTKMKEIFPRNGRVFIFHQRPTGDNDVVLKYKMMDRENYMKGAASISFHKSKYEVSTMETKLRTLEGQERLFFSYTGDHPKTARMLRGASASGKHMLATTAARVGQNIPRTQVAFIELEHDRASVIQCAGRAGRDSLAYVFISCGDPDEDKLAKLVATDARIYLLHEDQKIRLPLESPAMFYKNACVFLDRYITHFDGVGDWRKCFLQFAHVPALVNASIDDALSMSVQDARDVFFKAFMESASLSRDVAKPALLRAREFEPKIQIVRSGDGHVLAEVSRTSVFQHFFPESVHFSIHQPNRFQWKFDAFSFYKDDQEGNAVDHIAIDDIRKIFVEEEELSGTKFMVTRGILKSNDPSVRHGTTLRSLPLSLQWGGASNIEMQLQTAIITRVFSHYVKKYIDIEENQNYFSGEKSPPLLDNNPSVGLWKDGSVYKEHTMSWTIRVCWEMHETFKTVWKVIKRQKSAVAFFIGEHFGISSDSFMLEYGARSAGKKHTLTINVTETTKGRALGICIQMMGEPFVAELLRSLNITEEC